MNNTSNNVNSTFPKTQKKLIIAEKPSVGKTYANILGVTQMKDGYMESDTWIVTWSVGHLIELSYPEAYDPALKKGYGNIAISARTVQIQCNFKRAKAIQRCEEFI